VALFEVFICTVLVQTSDTSVIVVEIRSANS